MVQKFGMKKTLIILVLLFSSSVVADDISDFEIEGMSIGDSALDYYGEPMANYVRITPWKENMPISIWDTLLGEFKEGKCS